MAPLRGCAPRDKGLPLKFRKPLEDHGESFRLYVEKVLLSRFAPAIS